MKTQIARCLRAMALALLVAFPATAIELVGTRTATFEWAPASGDVYLYAVYVERNGGPRLAVELVKAPRATIEAAFGDEIVVSIRAVGFSGSKTIVSPYSPRSEPVRFLTPPRFGGDGTLALHCATCGMVQFRSITDGAILGQQPVPQGAWRIVEAVDVDGDDERDLILRDDDSGGLIVLLLLNYTVVEASVLFQPSMIDRRVVGTGDFDGDGRADIVLHVTATGMVELWNPMSGELTQIAGANTKTGATIETVADISGDGVPDLLWRNPATGSLEIWTIRNSSLVRIAKLTAGVSAGWDLATIGDFNDDGSLDLLWRNPADGSLSIWYLQQTVFQREASLPWLEGDEMLDVVGAVDLTGILGQEVILQDIETGDAYVLFPFSEDAPSRLRISTPGSRWRIIDAYN